jgi:hypothetical protein
MAKLSATEHVRAVLLEADGPLASAEIAERLNGAVNDGSRAMALHAMWKSGEIKRLEIAEQGKAKFRYLYADPTKLRRRKPAAPPPPPVTAPVRDPLAPSTNGKRAPSPGAEHALPSAAADLHAYVAAERERAKRPAPADVSLELALRAIAQFGPELGFRVRVVFETEPAKEPA